MAICLGKPAFFASRSASVPESNPSLTTLLRNERCRTFTPGGQCSASTLAYWLRRGLYGGGSHREPLRKADQVRDLAVFRVYRGRLRPVSSQSRGFRLPRPRPHHGPGIR